MIQNYLTDWISTRHGVIQFISWKSLSFVNRSLNTNMMENLLELHSAGY